jgi:membrane protein YqaA with SNARE-associated domain
MKFLSRSAGATPRHRWRNPENLLRLGVLLAVLAVAGAAILLYQRLDLTQIGYMAVAITALVASGGLIIPVPALATACTTSAFLNPAFIGLIAGTGETLGELTGYFLGYSGRGVMQNSRLYQRLEGWMRRRGWLVLFLLALIPNFLFDVAGVAAGALRYPLWKFLGIVWVGKLMKFLIIAYSCTYSVEWLTGLFGLG